MNLLCRPLTVLFCCSCMGLPVAMTPVQLSAGEKVFEVQDADGSNWSITVTPGTVPPKHLPMNVPPAPDADNANREIYRSIPFSRSAYIANPAYRHDATMEILFGKMRPTVIHRGTGGQEQPEPRTTCVAPHYSPREYDYTRGPYSHYQGLFGYRGGYRRVYHLNGGY